MYGISLACWTGNFFSSLNMTYCMVSYLLFVFRFSATATHRPHFQFQVTLFGVWQLVCGPCLPQIWIISTTYFLPMGHIQVKYTTHWTLTSNSNTLHIMGKHITTWLWGERDCRGSKSGSGDLCDYSRVVTLFPKGELAVTPWRLCNHLMPLATHTQNSPSF